MEACRGRDPLIPNVRLDHGADPNIEVLGYIGALVSEVEDGKPMELIRKTVECGDVVRPIAVRMAIG